MNPLNELQIAIEHLRSRLHELVAAKGGSFSDPAVTELSEQLDRLIVDYEHQKALTTEKREN